MRKRTFRHIVGILARYRRHEVWRKIVTVLSCIVIFCTTYALILPAITMEKAPACGKDEHTHTEECYTQVTAQSKTVPVCTPERLELHEHTEECKDENGEYSCGLADFVVHEHDASCYDEKGNLWCPLPEIEAHTHDDSCYSLPSAHTHGEACYTLEQGDLICTQSTEPVHAHTESCYASKETLVCTIPESDGHRHEENCYTAGGERICGTEESEGHHHNESCYSAVPVLICQESQEPAHTHVSTCYYWNKSLTCQESTAPVDPEQSAAPVLTCEKEEILLHEHTQEDCYVTDKEGNTYLVCDKTEILEHVHTEGCFQTVEEPVDTESLTCGLEEGQGAHTHGENCYDENHVLTCTQEESQGHRHTALCHGTWTLTCGKEEHTHTDACREESRAEYRWSQDGLEITASFGPEVELPENAVLVVERQTPDTPVPLAQLRENLAIQTVSQESVPGETAAQENSESSCMDYFRVYLAVDGIQVNPQAPADVSIRLQSEKYRDASHVELVQFTEDSEQSVPAETDPNGNLTANFTGALAGDYAVMALADTQPAPMATGTNAAASLTPHKSIEALAEVGQYRLHLDAVAGAADSPMNMLLVVDRSGSMGSSMSGIYGDGDSRDTILGDVVNGERDWNDKHKGNGLVNQFLSKNSENQIAVVGFAGAQTPKDGSADASILQSWTRGVNTVNLGNLGDATNYCAAFLKADEMLSAVPNSNPTIMVFLSDGVPTYYFDASGTRGGDGTSAKKNVEDSIRESRSYFEKYILTKHPEVTVYTVGISKEIVGTGNDSILEEMAQNGGGQYYGAATAGKLKEYIAAIQAGKTYTNLVIQDTLSDYVDIAEQPDIQVKVNYDGGVENILYRNGSVIPFATDILKEVTVTPAASEPLPAGVKRTITATFQPGCELEPGATYSLSYNVKVTQAAADQYAANSTYPHTGDSGTDYGTNTTSSGQPGFRSNDTATMSYHADGNPGSKSYPHPVVQVANVVGPTPQPEIGLTTHKTIDAFRDDADNPDTDLDNSAADKTDLYRLYLDAQVQPQKQPIDLLLVIDQSGSMHKDYDPPYWNDMEDYSGGKIYRDDALNLVLNGANGDDGLITKFLNAHDENMLAVAVFQGDSVNNNYGTQWTYDRVNNTDADTRLEWTHDPTPVTVEGIYGNSTNYTAGFLEAERLLASSTTNHKKVMLFLSDGVPTAFIAYNEATNTYYRDGNGRDTGPNDSTPNGTTTGDATDTAFEEFVANHPDLLIHTVNIRGSDDPATNPLQRLQGMATPGVGHCYDVKTTNELRKALSKLMYGTAYTELKIEDTLSPEVDLYESQPDYKVTLTDRKGNVTVLYDPKTGITAAGTGILQSVTYDSTARKVTALFNPSYTPAPGNKVTLSFNVKTSQAAYDEYAANGNNYGSIVGDLNTDYTGNATSSEMPGFYSNDFENTKVTYTKYNEANSESLHYPKPVIQVSSNGPGPNDSDLTFTPRKTIDAFRDGTNNPDTNLDNTASDKTDLYRLYLDTTVAGQGNGIDLLIVVDESGSMTTTDMDGMSREAAIRKILNGAATQDAYNSESMQEGLIYKFMDLNAQNKYAVVGFYGKARFSNAYSDAADINGGWKSTVNYVDVTTPPGDDGYGQRTNYCAGLKVASDMLDQVKDDGNKKIMLFLSDGVPTYYMTSPTSTSRRGTGLPYRLGFLNNPRDCADGTITYFDTWFAPSHTDVIINTVGIFPGEDGNNEYSTSTEVLNHMVSNGGQFVSATNTKGVEDALLDFVTKTDVTNLVIEDELSPYVDLYTGQPDYKLTMIDEKGNQKDLWIGNAATAAGSGIVESVSYDAAARKVIAKFVPGYSPKLGCRYTLSFNVQATQAAYDEYAKNGYGSVTGNANTDYGGNATSSGKDGFHSNTQANVKYQKGTETVREYYPHPVVQVATCKIVIQKTDGNDQTKPLKDAKFDIYRKAQAGETGKPLGDLEGTYVKVEQEDNPGGVRPATDENGQLVFRNLVPGDYWLVETQAPTGYKRLTEPIKVTLTRGTNGGAQIVGSTETVKIGDESLPMLKIANTPWGHKLPATGGTGREPYTIGGLLIVSLAVLLLYSKKRGKEDAASSKP